MVGQVLVPGTRVGWVTAAPSLIEKIIFHLQGVHVGPNSFTQARYIPLLHLLVPASCRPVMQKFCRHDK